MARVAMLWTEAIDALLSDGEWHDKEEVLITAAAAVPVERALAEMDKNNRSQLSDEARRIAAGQKTLAQQALMGRKRFGQVKFSPDGKRVCKVSAGSTSPGELVERVETLEAQVIELRDQMSAALDRIGALYSVTEGDSTVSDTASSTTVGWMDSNNSLYSNLPTEDDSK